MKPRIEHQPQDQEGARADAEGFDAWLKTPKGQAWPNDAEQEQDERQVLSVWEGW